MDLHNQALVDKGSESSFDDCITNLCDTPWMGLYVDHIRHKRLWEVALPGTHDSGSYAITPTSPISLDKIKWHEKWALRILPRSKRDIAAGWARTTSKDFAQQLDMGIRYFDLRVQYSGGSGTGRFHLVHGFVGAPVSELVGKLGEWLEGKGREREVVLLDFNHFYGMQVDAERLECGPHAELIEMLMAAFPYQLASRYRFLDRHSTLEEIWRTSARIFVLYGEPTYAKMYGFLGHRQRDVGTGDVYGRWAHSSDVKKVMRVCDETVAMRLGMLKVVEAVLTPTKWMYVTSVCRRRKVGASEDSLRAISKGMRGVLNERMVGWGKDPDSFMVNVVMVDWFEGYMDRDRGSGLVPFVDAVVRLNLR